MLLELRVENLGAIERAEIALEEGLGALTGETGAGKTLLVAALGLLLGGRADRVLVRSGAAEARVEGRFLLSGSDEAVKLLAQEEIVEPADEVELVVSRTVPASGRASSARINGRLVTAALLTEISSQLAEIAGQHDQVQIGKPAWQRQTLDMYAGETATELARSVRATVVEAARTDRLLEELISGERSRSRELDVLRYEIAEIEAAGPEPGESAAISSELSRIEHAETLTEGLSEAATALGGEGGAQERVDQARAQLGRLADLDPELKPLVDRLGPLEIELADVAAELGGRISAPDPENLEGLRERLQVLSRLKRKYGEDERHVLEYLDRARTRESELAGADADLPTLERRAIALRSEAQESAERLSELRAESAGRMRDEIQALLGELAMTGACFEVALTPAELHEGGLETVQFRLAANPGEEPRSLAKVASGGELSRIALALYLVTSSNPAATMVFDEVDAGVGGAAAQAVGRSLARLAASGAQVIVITHLPQVAAFADVHASVEKAESEGRSSAQVRRLTGDERIAELSRMLAGLPDSERGREHAQELLEIASGIKP